MEPGESALATTKVPGETARIAENTSRRNGSLRSHRTHFDEKLTQQIVTTAKTKKTAKGANAPRAKQNWTLTAGAPQINEPVSDPPVPVFSVYKVTRRKFLSILLPSRMIAIPRPNSLFLTVSVLRGLGSPANVARHACMYLSVNFEDRCS